VVPIDGGRVLVNGFDLFSNADHPPIAELVDVTHKQVLATLDVTRGDSDDQVGMVIDDLFIDQHLSEVVDLHLRVFRKPLIGKKKFFDLYLPMAMPSPELRASLYVTATIYFTFAFEEPGVLPVENFHATNGTNSDVNYGPVSRTVIPDVSKCRITSIDTWYGGMNRWGDTHATASWTPSSLTVSGVLEDAEDYFGAITAHSCLDFNVRPKVLWLREQPNTLTGQSTPVRLDGQSLQLTLNMPKPNDPNDPSKPVAIEKCDAEFAVFRIFPDAAVKEVVRSQRISFGASGGEFPSAVAGKQLLTGYFTPGQFAPEAQLTVTVKTESCGH
jgi:hypothetical protein